MVFTRRQDEGRRLNFRQIDRCTGKVDPTGLCQEILLIHVTQIERMHCRWHSCRIGIPKQKIKGHLLLTEQVIVDDKGPNQVIRAQHIERRRHILRIQIPALAHPSFERNQLLFVDEDGRTYAPIKRVSGSGCRSRCGCRRNLRGRRCGCRLRYRTAPSRHDSPQPRVRGGMREVPRVRFLGVWVSRLAMRNSMLKGCEVRANKLLRTAN